MTVIRFKIGDAFPASDPVARFITGLAMTNDWLRSLEEMFKLGDTPEEAGRQMSLLRRQAALVHEAATFITDARRMFRQVASFIHGPRSEGTQWLRARDCGGRPELAGIRRRVGRGPSERHPSLPAQI